MDEVAGGPVLDEEFARELVDRARAEGIALVGPGGLLGGLTKQVIETALEVEMSDHLGYEAYDPIGRNGGNSRNGVRSKTVMTEVGPVEIDVPRDRDGTFEPQIVWKRQRRLAGVDSLVLSLTAKGLTSGEISAHFAEIYGTSVSKETISRITDQVIEAMVEWQNRPLDRVYPVIFIDALFVKIRDGQVANRPIYIAIGVTVDGERDILGLWVGPSGGEGAKFWLTVLTETREPWGRGRVHRGLRWSQGAAGGDRGDLACCDHPDLCAAPDPPHVPSGRPPALGSDRQGAAADLHRADRTGRPPTSGRVQRRVG